MNRLTILLISMALGFVTPAVAESEFDSAKQEAWRSFVHSDEGRSWQIIFHLFNDQVVRHDVDQCLLMALGKRDEGLVREPWPCVNGGYQLVEGRVSGLSESGRRALKTAIQEFRRHYVDKRNDEARRMLQLCESGVLEPVPLANYRSDIHDLHTEGDIKFYKSVIEQMDASDQATMQQNNVDFFGLEAPMGGQYWRKLAVELALNYPDEYIAAHQERCSKVNENKGIPFKKFRQERTRDDCVESVTHTLPDGSTDISHHLSSDEACRTVEYYAQNAREPGDTIVDLSEPIPRRVYPKYTWLDCDGNVHQSDEEPKLSSVPCVVGN